jgi:hypothetical protein
MADEGNVAGSNLYVVSQNEPASRVAGSSLYTVSQVSGNARIAGSSLYSVSQVNNNARLAGSLLYVVVKGLIEPIAVVPSITGTVGAPALFDASGSSGSPGYQNYYIWTWTSLPGGTSITNNGSSQFPDGGGSSWISMVNNEVLFHAEDNLDSSGSGNSASLSGITSGSISGKVGQYAWSYDNTSSKAIIATPVDLSGDYTISFWFYDLDPEGGYRTSMCADSGEFIPMLLDPSGLLGLWNGTFVSSGNYMYAVDFSGWHQVTITATGTSTKWYVDGELYGECSAKISQSLGYIGNNGFYSQRFAGRIDEFSVWSRVLTPAEISSIYIFQSQAFANYGQILTFVPDVAGTYEVTMKVFNGPIDYYDEVVAQAIISSPPSGLVILKQGLQGDFDNLSPLQGNIGLQGD